MPIENKPMTGMLFVNMSDNPKAPKLRGFIFDEQMNKYQLSLWTVTDRDSNEPRRDKNNKPFWNIKIRRDDEDPQPQREPPPPTDDDELPY